MNVILTEKQENGIYTVTLTGKTLHGDEIKQECSVNIKSIINAESDRLQNGGFDLATYGDLIGERLRIKAAEVKAEAVKTLHKFFNERVDSIKRITLK